MNVWNIKMIYAMGSHVVTDKYGVPLKFENKQLATFECETLNSKRKDRDTYYIPVEEERFR